MLTSNCPFYSFWIIIFVAFSLTSTKTFFYSKNSVIFFWFLQNTCLLCSMRLAHCLRLNKDLCLLDSTSLSLWWKFASFHILSLYLIFLEMTKNAKVTFSGLSLGTHSEGWLLTSIKHYLKVYNQINVLLWRKVSYLKVFFSQAITWKSV